MLSLYSTYFFFFINIGVPTEVDINFIEIDVGKVTSLLWAVLLWATSRPLGGCWSIAATYGPIRSLPQNPQEWAGSVHWTPCLPRDHHSLPWKPRLRCSLIMIEWNFTITGRGRQGVIQYPYIPEQWQRLESQAVCLWQETNRCSELSPELQNHRYHKLTDM